jgi:non-ribosomal peptide synthetase component F
VIDALGANPADDAGLKAVRYVRRTAEVPAGVVERLRKWARDEGTTDFVVLATAAAVAVADVLGKERVGVGTVLDNRSDAAIERTVGPFATSTLLAVDISAATPRELARRMRRAVAESRRWADLPLLSLLDRPCAELGLVPSDLVDVAVAIVSPYHRATDTLLPLASVADDAAPLVRATVGAPPTVTFHLAPVGTIRVSAEAADTGSASAGRLALRIAAALRVFAFAADSPIALSGAADQ